MKARDDDGIFPNIKSWRREVNAEDLEFSFEYDANYFSRKE